MEKAYQVIDNEREHRYEIRVDGLVPFIEYIKTKSGDVHLTHTEVPGALQGKGIGKILVRGTLEKIGADGMKVVPLCGFVAGYIRRNPEWKRIVKEGIYV